MSALWVILVYTCGTLSYGLPDGVLFGTSRRAFELDLVWFGLLSGLFGYKFEAFVHTSLMERAGPLRKRQSIRAACLGFFLGLKYLWPLVYGRDLGLGLGGCLWGLVGKMHFWVMMGKRIRYR